jgi:ketosteroid isomerase-like protein
MSQEHVDVVRRNLAAWHDGDLDAWLATGHPEVEGISEIARRVEDLERVYRGHDGLRRYWDDWHSVWDVTIDVEEMRDLVYGFEGALIRRSRAYLDPQQALDAIRHSKHVP